MRNLFFAFLKNRKPQGREKIYIFCPVHHSNKADFQVGIKIMSQKTHRKIDEKMND